MEHKIIHYPTIYIKNFKTLCRETSTNLIISDKKKQVTCPYCIAVLETLESIEKDKY